MSANPNAPPPKDAFAACAAMASALECRVIRNEQGPYLSRYTLCERADGGAVYLHFFHQGDASDELHNHPWDGRSLILAGGYREERLTDRFGFGADFVIAKEVFRPGDINIVESQTFHRVDLLDARGCWTIFETGPRETSWGFLSRSGVFTPWRDALEKRGLL